MIAEWKAFLLERTGEWDLPTRGEWTFLLSNNYRPNYSTLALLWFHNGDAFPRVVTKVFREPQIPKREYETLSHVYRCAPEWTPRPLHFGTQRKFWAVWMEGVPGLPYRPAMNGLAGTLEPVVEAITSIHAAVRRDAGGDPDRYSRCVSEPLRTLAQFGTSVPVREGCAMLSGRISPEWLTSMPVIPQHGDLCASNVLLHRDKSHVIDWESFGVVNLPYYDLFTFLFSLLQTDGETPDQWNPSLMKHIPRLVDRYARALGLSDADISTAFSLTLANWFHIQWCDGRNEFTSRMYRTIQHYFEHRSLWEQVFVPAAAERMP